MKELTLQVAEEFAGVPTKVCPQCGQTLFADMDVCYGCLHSFTLGEGRPADPPTARGSHVPAHLTLSMGRAWVDDGTDLSMDEPPEVTEEGPWTWDDDPPLAGGSVAAHVLDDEAEDATGPRPPVGPIAGELTMVLDPSAASFQPGLALRMQTAAMDVTVPLPPGGLSIGRSPDNDVVLHSRAVSRRHLRVEPTGEGASVFDLGATNPALYHGHEAPAELVLSVGDMVDVCGALVTLARV